MEITESEERGVKAIIHLQGIMGKVVTQDKALGLWRFLKDNEKRTTMAAYAIFQNWTPHLTAEQRARANLPVPPRRV